MFGLKDRRSTPTTDPTPAGLPAGHDDPGSEFHVPAEMREHYAKASPGDDMIRRYRDALADHLAKTEAAEAQRPIVDAEIRRLQDTGHGIRAAWLRDQFSDDAGQFRPWRDPARATGEAVTAAIRSMPGISASRILTVDEERYADHRARLQLATDAHQAAQLRATRQARAELAETCTICGQRRPDTAERPAFDHERMCGDCLIVAEAELADRLATVTLPDGRTRRAAAAAWLDTEPTDPATR